MGIGPPGKGLFVPVLTDGAPGIDETFGVADRQLTASGVQQQIGQGNSGRAGPVDHDLGPGQLLAGHLEGIEQTGETDHRRAVPIVVKDGDIHLRLQGFLDLETPWAGDVSRLIPP